MNVPRRASVAPILDLFITLLHLGADGWTKLLVEREALLVSFRERLACTGARGAYAADAPQLDQHGDNIELWWRRAAGDLDGRTAVDAPRLGLGIVAPSSKPKREVAGIPFKNFGSRCDAYPNTYMTAACAIGAAEAEVDRFFKRLTRRSRSGRR